MDIFSPEISTVTKGLKGKSVLLYGGNRVGKTSNAVKATKSVVLRVEQGLNALSGVRNFPIHKWSDFTTFIKQLTNPATTAKAHEMYETIIVDTVDSLLNYAEDFVANSFGVQSVDRDSTGKKGYGVWREFRKEVQKQINALTNAGFSIIFIAHEDTRSFIATNGEEYDKAYPKGDKKSIDILCDLCDFIAYAQTPPDEEGVEGPRLSTLYLSDTYAYKAGSRYIHLTPSIPEWNMEKFEAAVNEAIEAEEQSSGIKAEDFDKKVAAEAKKAAKAESTKKSIPELVEAIGDKVRVMIGKEGNKAVYEDILETEVGNRDFRCQEATEKQREQLELILAALTAKGY